MAFGFRKMRLLFDESLSPRLVSLIRDLFPESESALRNGLARVGDRGILEYAAARDFVLVSQTAILSGWWLPDRDCGRRASA